MSQIQHASTPAAYKLPTAIVKTFRATPIGEFVAANPEKKPPIIHGLLLRQDVMNIVAAPKMKKSWLVNGLAFAIATGTPWLGHKTEKGRVLLLDAEVPTGTLSERLQSIAAALGGDSSGGRLDLSTLPIDIECLRGRGWDLDTLKRELSTIQPGKYSVIIVDPIYKFLGVLDESASGTMNKVYDVLMNLAETIDAAFVSVHHFSKGLQIGKSGTDMGSGSGVQSRAADIHLVMQKHSVPDAAVISADIRSLKPIPAFSVYFDHPLWVRDDTGTLDPAMLAKNVKSQKEAAAPKAEPKTWTIDEFAAIYSSTMIGKDSVISTAVENGITKTEATSLLRRSVEAGKLFKWKLPGNACGYSTISQPPKPLATADHPAPIC